MGCSRPGQASNNDTQSNQDNPDHYRRHNEMVSIEEGGFVHGGRQTFQKLEMSLEYGSRLNKPMNKKTQVKNPCVFLDISYFVGFLLRQKSQFGCLEALHAIIAGFHAVA
jgi:hypothetical protein